MGTTRKETTGNGVFDPSSSLNQVSLGGFRSSGLRLSHEKPPRLLNFLIPPLAPSPLASLESTLGVSEPGAKSCYICWVLTDAHLRQETSQHKALSRGHLTLFLLLWTQPCLSPLLPLAFSCLRPLAFSCLGLWPLFLGRKVWGREGKPQARQPTTTAEEGACCTEAGLQEGRPQGVGGRQQSPLSSQPATLPPDPCTTPRAVHCGNEGVRE